MAKPNQVTESSMEEILASIRKIISEDEARATAARPAPNQRPTTAPPRPASNVSPLFRSEGAAAAEPSKAAVEKPASAVRQENSEAEDWIAQRPIYPKLDDIRPTEKKEERPTKSELAPPKAPQSGSLLSPSADAAVASAFYRLASTAALATNSRSIEQVAEDMLRPMLKDWLDENLPPLVERLVREEIERVSRRR